MNEAIRPARNVELGASNEPFQNLYELVRKSRGRPSNLTPRQRERVRALVRKALLD